ncbi:MAG: adenylate/guanylate cyclase domain-containing protein, partial [Pseudolabrys sp.]
IGIVGIYRQEVRPFSDKRIEIVKNFASQAVIAIENVRLFEEVQARTRDLTESLEQQTATSEVLKVISSSPGDLKPVFEAMLESATRICGAGFGAMFRIENGEFEPVAFHNVPEVLERHLTARGKIRPRSGSTMERVMRTKDVVHVVDLWQDADGPGNPASKYGNARTYLGVPMLNDNELVGAIVIFRQEVKPFGDKQVELVKNFASQAVIAIENVRLLSELRQREQDLTEKSTTLAALSSKLAKYLAPQVYDSIFTGQQDVKIVSARKKLTVCFSDLVGFTEITDQMESEDLTQLLNQYLTEMSKIALQYGATIDKYVGDAIVMFFGDPTTLGVKQDALACVQMAIAMQQRVGELAQEWRGIGIGTPLRCRIGIHTGYCTVGNFGSEDRMDYTMVGGTVNLASRLEHEAPPGGILISFETYAHVQDEVHCEERGQVQVKGIAHPVATYAVLGPKQDAERDVTAHLQLDLDPERMTDDERRAAAEKLRCALGLLEKGAKSNG